MTEAVTVETRHEETTEEFPDHLPAALVELLQERGCSPDTLYEKLGMRITEATAERASGTMPVEGNTQPYRLLHGGASLAFAETLASIAAILHAGRTRVAVGAEVSATHHRPARSGLVHGEATAIHLGPTTATYEVLIKDARQRRLCTVRVSCAIRPL
ncbi:hotdog fold thioesterase [Streptacidiphilus jiangxiensis]|uniref:Uncharacterized domain 1-containing protein n=1 Tax=Streptacidiphilus jiangxiensis TaxID=235985 RepID=A0A1H7VPL7_STRJI|nr:hotdog fold thioesterase [Streptacidiphilus jiangxiensis]SEM10737.1 uncharacterized domain 1-containing protein [Streptacidiphilus jiangxiensis]